MSLLNISKVAVGCASVDALHKRQRQRVRDGEVPVYTRFRPKRAEELVGGSLYWIIKHRISVRQTILGFADDEEQQKTVIRLDPTLVPVRAQPKRAHQGWRYLTADDAPQDWGDEAESLGELPPALLSQLAVLALI